MPDLPEQSITRAQRDFEAFRKKLTFTADDQEQLIWDATDLLGWYAARPGAELEGLIGRMIDFGEKKQWSMGATQLQFTKLKAKRRATGRPALPSHTSAASPGQSP